MGRAGSPQNQKYEGMRIAEIAKLRGDADPADTCITLMAEDGGTHQWHVPHDVRGRRADRDEEAVGGDRQRRLGDQPGRARRSASAQLQHERARARPLRPRRARADDGGCGSEDDSAAGGDSRTAAIAGSCTPASPPTSLCSIQQPLARRTRSSSTKSYARGVEYVLVNGAVVIDKGEHTGVKPGKALRGPGVKQGKRGTKN